MRLNNQYLNRVLLLVALFSMLACYGPFRNTEKEEMVPTIEEAEEQQEVEEQEPEEEAPETDADLIQAELPEETNTPEFPGVSFEGIQFTYDPALAREITPKVIEATPVEEDGPWWGAEPRHVQFDLEGYPLQETFHEPYILVYPVDEFASLSESGQYVMDLMKTVLAEHSQNPERLPFLPLFNAGALIRAQYKYIEFKNGSGFRYVTQFGQATNEINNHELFYTFQGMTSDQKYYVAAVLPMNSPLLPAQSTLNGDNYMEFEQNFETYIKDLKEKMDAEMPQQFTPNLSLLDALFESVQVNAE